MQYSFQAAKLISSLAVKRLRELCGDPNKKFSQSMLVRNDVFCGLRYRAGEFRAEWISDSDSIQIYRRDDWVESYPITTPGDVGRRAA